MPRKARILIVEDEIAIRTGLVDVFVFHGYDVDFADNGNDGLQKGLTGQFDLILLDVMMPGKNGFEVCEAIRQQDRDQPIIMLTAKSTDEDIIQGLSLGADDYVAKPFSVAQLVLRVQAVLRRSKLDQEQDTRIRLSDTCEIDTPHLTGNCAGQAVHFTRREMDIIQYLHEHNDRPVPREELLNKVWGYAKDMDIETRTVDIHIAKLRRKLEPDPKNPVYLVTVRGGGYKLLSGSA
ncbi:MAG: response regulator transcription factor [Pseudomonadales bacterium]|uniref:Response regulator receiver-modulated signal transduction transcriptional regulator n=1 Tax=Oleiphilus messinensis TaxID=141451 RepID=A0A1Y0I294_9GAMM|nr:response regulator transcription factor [Oleiphilus messinensis]ARU54618.1 response regulator receiver-modulated signal transduction transcriptional regulator [Oleiphilus messinensis]MCG8611878.1 response regulator transcription factor [Pseudomonadales bacterium]